MKKMNLCFIGLFSVLILLSCTNSEESDLILPQESKVSILGESITLKNGMLNFESKQSLNSILSKIGQMDSHEALKVEDFKSLFDIYDEALEEAPTYYDSKENYKTFKEKYSSLYFPEHGNDYAAYLPISDKNLAKLANGDGNILVAGEIIDCKNISTYEDLAALGWADPDEATLSTRAAKTEVFYRKSGDNKLWINVSSQTYPGVGYTYHFEVCFRDKGLFGAWYNRKASTKIQVGHGRLNTMSYPDPTIENFGLVYQSNKNDSFSSHDYTVTTSSLNVGLISFGPWGDKFYAFDYPQY